MHTHAEDLSYKEMRVSKCVCLSLTLLPVVAGDVVDPEGVSDVLLALVLVFAEARQHVDLVELGVDGGSLSEARHRHCGDNNGNHEWTRSSARRNKETYLSGGIVVGRV